MSSKRIVTIEVHNLKAIDHQALNLHGCSCIVTAGNRKGKSTLLRGLIDRIQGVKPEMVVKKDESKGFSELTLSTGERIRWDFSQDGKEKLTFTTTEGIRTSLTREIANRYFPSSFDIDRFLQSSPKDRVEQLQSLLGIDLSDIRSRYKAAYDDRTYRNQLSKELKAKVIPISEDDELLLHADPKPIKPLQEDLAKAGELNASYDKSRQFVESAKKRIVEYGDQFKQLEADKEEISEQLASDLSDVDMEIERLKEKKKMLRDRADRAKEEKDGEKVKVKSDMEALSAKLKAGEEWLLKPENKPIPVENILQDIDDANLFNRRIEEVKKAKETHLDYEKAYADWQQADEQVKAIEREKVEMLQQAHLPEGISIDGDNITVDGLPLDRLQQSTSELYIVALKLAALKLGEVGALHFDAATLDRPNLERVMKWAEESGLQLLIERPDFDGGEIEYQLLSHPSEEPVTA